MTDALLDLLKEATPYVEIAADHVADGDAASANELVKRMKSAIATNEQQRDKGVQAWKHPATDKWFYTIDGLQDLAAGYFPSEAKAMAAGWNALAEAED